MLHSVCFIRWSRDRTGRSGMFSKQEGRGSSGDAESDARASWRTATQIGDRDGSVENNT